MDQTTVLTHEAVLKEIDSVCGLRVRPQTHGPKTKVTVTADAIVFRPGGGSHSLELTEAGGKSLAAFTGMPEKFGRWLTPGTFGVLATELLERKKQYALITRDGRIDGFGKAQDYRDFNAERTLATIDRAVPGNQIRRVMKLDNYTVSFDIISDTEVAVSKGDLVRAGANIVFSLIGTTLPKVSSYAEVMFCTNGQTTTDVFREFAFGGGDGGGSYWPWLNKSVRESAGAVGRIVRRYQQLLGEGIAPGERAAILTALLDKARIRGEVADAIRAEALEHPPINAYEMMNLITFASSHLVDEPKDVIRIRKVSDDFAHEKTHASSCPLCHHEGKTVQIAEHAESTE